jgi:AcrR family transcriptional regulator
MDELLRGKPFVEIRIADLAAHAGVSPASIYQRFSNRDALVAILIELYLRRIQEWMSSPDRQALIKAGSLREALRLVGSQTWEMAEQLGYVIAPAYLQSRLRPDLLDETWAELEWKSRNGFRQMLSAFPEDLGDVDPIEAADAIATCASMMLMAKLLHRREPGSTLPQTAEAYGEMIADFGSGLVRERALRTSADDRD